MTTFVTERGKKCAIRSQFDIALGDGYIEFDKNGEKIVFNLPCLAGDFADYGEVVSKDLDENYHQIVLSDDTVITMNHFIVSIEGMSRHDAQKAIMDCHQGLYCNYDMMKIMFEQYKRLFGK